MASPGYPETLNPYLTRKDCVKGFCTLYCPQWCFTISPPPPPPFEFPDDDSGPSFPPLIIAIIGILASAFLLVCYYTIISKYCGSRNRRGHQNHVPRAEFGEDGYGNSGSVQEPWHVSGQGLDESLIKSITICKFKKGVGQFEGATCSVCLSEIVEDESIKLLPKCNHAFHVQCIDTWLKSHLNCPLCRSDIAFTSSSLVQSPPPVTEAPPCNESLPEIHQENRNFAVEREESTNHGVDDVPKTPLRNFSVGNMEARHTIVEMGNGNHLGFQPIRRSFSMGHCGRSRLCVGEILRNKEHNEIQIEDCCLDNVGSPNLCVGGTKSLGYKMKLLHCVMRPAIMGRSFSCGRLSLSRHGRVQRAIIPL